MTEAARPQLAVPEFFDRVPRVRGWVISADESDSARALLATLLRGLFSDRMNLEWESHGYPQWDIEGWELVHDDESVEARLWRRFSPTGPEADLPGKELEQAAPADHLLREGALPGALARLPRLYSVQSSGTQESAEVAWPRRSTQALPHQALWPALTRSTSCCRNSGRYGHGISA